MWITHLQAYTVMLMYIHISNHNYMKKVIGIPHNITGPDISVSKLVEDERNVKSTFTDTKTMEDRMGHNYKLINAILSVVFIILFGIAITILISN